jgi:hypothetical protein
MAINRRPNGMTEIGQRAKNSNRAYLVRSCPQKQTEGGHAGWSRCVRSGHSFHHFVTVASAFGGTYARSLD